MFARAIEQSIRQQVNRVRTQLDTSTLGLRAFLSMYVCVSYMHLPNAEDLADLDCSVAHIHVMIFLKHFIVVVFAQSSEGSLY